MTLKASVEVVNIVEFDVWAAKCLPCPEQTNHSDITLSFATRPIKT